MRKNFTLVRALRYTYVLSSVHNARMVLKIKDSCKITNNYNSLTILKTRKRSRALETKQMRRSEPAVFPKHGHHSHGAGRAE